MTEVLLVRHGETVWNQEGRMQGQHDSPLTDTGLRQGVQVARRLKDVAFTTLYSSDLGRAYRTAQSIATETGHEIVVDVRLRERHFGLFEGLTGPEMKERHPAEYARFAARDPDYAVPGGESAAGFQVRCIACFDDLARRHRDETIVVVAHGLVLDALYRAASGMPLDQPRGFPLLNCSINTFRCQHPGWTAVKVCDVDHLEEGDVTHFQGRAV